MDLSITDNQLIWFPCEIGLTGKAFNSKGLYISNNP